MEKEGVEGELRRKRKKTRFIAFIFLGILLAAIGFVLLFCLHRPGGHGTRPGGVPRTRPAGKHLVPINRTDFG